jgi:hypothetical protein
MTETSADRDVVEFAAIVAVEIDRTRFPIVDGVRDRLLANGLPQRHSLSMAGLQLLPFFRHLLPDRSVSRAAVRACGRYIPDDTFDAGWAELDSAGLIQCSGSAVALSERGRAVAREMHDALVVEVNRLWGSDAALADLERLAQRALEAAAATGGPAFSVMAPPFDPPASTTGSRAAERLSCLRIHRSDAHAEAWAAAGLTAEQAPALGPGPQRDAIEQDTNRRASAPYEALAPGERGSLLGMLGGLPG